MLLLLSQQCIVVCVQEDTWPEAARRLLSLASLGQLVMTSQDPPMSGGLDIALGDYVGSSPFRNLGPTIASQGLLAGALPKNPLATVAALPVVHLFPPPPPFILNAPGIDYHSTQSTRQEGCFVAHLSLMKSALNKNQLVDVLPHCLIHVHVAWKVLELRISIQGASAAAASVRNARLDAGSLVALERCLAASSSTGSIAASSETVTTCRRIMRHIAAVKVRLMSTLC